MKFSYFIEPFTKDFFHFKGRARRSQYIAFWLMKIFVILPLGSAIAFLLSVSGLYIFAPLLLFYYVYLGIVNLGITVRRLHDMGYSGWMYLIYLIPIVNVIFWTFLFIIDSEEGKNRFGENPKEKILKKNIE